MKDLEKYESYEEYANRENELSLYPEKLDSIDFMRCAPDDAELCKLEDASNSAAYTVGWLRRGAGDYFFRDYGKRIIGVAKWFAAMFKSQGFSYDDAIQTACMVSLKIKAECRDERWLAFQMKHRLPQYMWREVRGLLPQESGFEAQEHLLRVPERETKRWIEILEMEDMLERALSGTDLAVAQALLAGRTQAEIAAALDLSQSAVSARIRSIRCKLRPVFLGTGPNEKGSPHATPDSSIE